MIDTLDEPPPDATLAERRPASYARERAIPSFLVIGARKQEAPGPPPATTH